MKFRNCVWTALAAAMILSLTSCGGGGDAMSVLTMVPGDDFYMVAGFRPDAKFNSPIYKDMKGYLKAFEDVVEDWEDRIDDLEVQDLRAVTLSMDILSEDTRNNLVYLGGRFQPDDLEDYYEDVRGWERWRETTRRNRSYFTAKWGDREMAVYHDQRGFFSGDADIIEDLIDSMASREDLMVEDRDFHEARQLVDFNATEFHLRWDDVRSFNRLLWSYLKEVDDDEALEDAVEDIKAFGQSIQYGNTLRITWRMKFKNREAVNVMVDFLKEDMDDVFELVGPRWLLEQTDILRPGTLGYDEREELRTHLRRKLDDLGELVRIAPQGDVLELSIELNSDQLEDLFD